MTTYLLDTTVLVDYFRGGQRARLLLERLADDGHTLAICNINIAELFAGLPEAQRPLARELLDSLHYLETTRSVAEFAGLLRFNTARQGIVLHLPDAMIAAVAIANDATLVTANVRDFPMKELQLLELPSS